MPFGKRVGGCGSYPTVRVRGPRHFGTQLLSAGLPPEKGYLHSLRQSGQTGKSTPSRHRFRWWECGLLCAEALREIPSGSTLVSRFGACSAVAFRSHCPYPGFPVRRCRSALRSFPVGPVVDGRNLHDPRHPSSKFLISSSIPQLFGGVFLAAAFTLARKTSAQVPPEDLKSLTWEMVLSTSVSLSHSPHREWDGTVEQPPG